MDKSSYRHVKRLLEREAAKRNDPNELSVQRPDPLLVASCYRDEYIALVCALFGYGNARAIVGFLKKIDFALIGASDAEIEKGLGGFAYRFQSASDIIRLFMVLSKLKRENISLEALFREGYAPHGSVFEGLKSLIAHLYAIGGEPRSYGYRFLIGTIPETVAKAGAYKRYMMFFRWMVRKDSLDMGLWRRVDKRDLIMPLDTHTANVSRRLGLLKRKSNDFLAALELTGRLKKFDANDPLKYDFALYRIGQKKRIKTS